MANTAIRRLAGRFARRMQPRRRTDPAGSPLHHHRPGRAWRLMRLMIAGSKDHAFLDRVWVARLLRSCPADKRRSLALRLLSLSPHYWI